MNAEAAVLSATIEVVSVESKGIISYPDSPDIVIVNRFPSSSLIKDTIRAIASWH